MRSLREPYLRLASGSYRVATLADVDEGLTACRQLLAQSSPTRRRRILQDLDKLLDRRLELAGGAR